MTYSILVVDDEKEIQDAVSRHFRFLGYDVQTVSDGDSALGILADKKFDVLISDIRMPGMDGVSLMKIVRKEYPMMHVIMITGYVTQENVLSCMRHGADTCIFKPWTDMTELEASVQHAVDTLKNWKRKLHQLHDMKPAARNPDV